MKDWYVHFDDRFWLLKDDMPAEQARFIKRALRLRVGQRVLDVPCGAGRTSLALAKLGVEVTGVDLRAKFVNRAKRRFRREGLSGRFLVGDMRELDHDGEFHAVVSWYSSFGYFSDAENLDVLRRLARAVRPGGRLLIDVVNREHALRSFAAEDTTPSSGRKGLSGGTFTRRRRWNPRLERIEATWTLRRDQETITCPLRLRLYTPGQYERLFGRVGIEVQAIYGSWTGDAYSRTARRLVVVGRKPR